MKRGSSGFSPGLAPSFTAFPRLDPGLFSTHCPDTPLIPASSRICANAWLLEGLPRLRSSIRGNWFSDLLSKPHSLSLCLSLINLKTTLIKISFNL
jgi:hypothetical protein